MSDFYIWLAMAILFLMSTVASYLTEKQRKINNDRLEVLLKRLEETK
jgi:hypothetical protein